MKAFPAIFGAIGDILGGRLTLLALVNLVLAGVISGAGALALIKYVEPLIPHASGYLGLLYDVARLVFSAGSIVLGIALSPAASMFIGGLLFDTAARSVEKAIGAPTPRKASFLESLWAGIRIAIPSLLLNILVLPLYLIPGVNAFVFIALNGYLMGRDYAMAAGMRRYPFRDALKLRRRARLSVFLVGVVCAIIPFIGPLIGASGMTRLVNSLSSDPRVNRASA
ncbi:MAG: EI24 domain-containing protein [Pseudomonadota bacterium]